MSWTANNSASWLTLSATSGTLAPGGSTNITAAINANANSLAAGGYSDVIGFTNITNGVGNTTRAVSFNIGTFGFYDNFATFASGNLAGQQNWTQLGAISNVPIQVAAGQADFTGGLLANDQTVYKNFQLTNETVYYGMTLTLTNAPNSGSVTYFATMYTGTNGTGTAEFRLAAESPNAAKTNYVLGVRITPAGSDPYTFGTAGLSYGTEYQVIVQVIPGWHQYHRLRESHEWCSRSADTVREKYHRQWGGNHRGFIRDLAVGQRHHPQRRRFRWQGRRRRTTSGLCTQICSVPSRPWRVSPAAQPVALSRWP